MLSQNPRCGVTQQPPVRQEVPAADALDVRADVPTFLRVEPQSQVVGFTGLAELLKISRASAVTMHSRSPHRLPPACRGAGREPLWIVADVLAWLRSRPEQADVKKSARTTPHRHVGRPTKSEEVAARRAEVTA